MPTPIESAAAVVEQGLAIWEAWGGSIDQLNAWMMGTANGGPNGDGTYPMTNRSGGTVYVFCPDAIAALGGQGGAVSAEALGFVKGLGSAVQTANKAAWIALLQNGGSVFFGEGDWDFRFGALTQLASCPSISILGAGKRARIWVAAGPTLLDISWAAVEIAGVHFYAATPLGSGQIVGIDNLTANVAHVLVHDCWFTNVFVPIRTTSGTSLSVVNPYVVDELRLNRNHVLCRQGLCRISAHRGGRVVDISDNYIDCGAAGGIASGYGAIVYGLIVNTGLQLGPDDVGTSVTVTGNTVRNVKPWGDPGSPGNYGIQIQCPNARVTGNTVDKVYPFYGTAYTDTLFTGDGTTKTFSGTLAHFPTPDSLTISTGGVVKADDADHGWAHGDTANPTTTFGRQKICDTAGAEIGWVDYNSGAWSVTWATAPANSAFYTASYFQGTPIDNVEPIYTKSDGVIIADNHLLNNQARQGAISTKGGGTNGYLQNGTWRGGPNSAYGAIVSRNVIWNRVQTGIFSSSRGIWCQQDVLTAVDNLFIGLTDRIFRLNLTGHGAQISCAGKVRDFYGQTVATVPWPTSNMRLSFDVDGLFFAGTGPITLVDIDAPNGTAHKNMTIENVAITDRVTAGKVVVIAAVDLDPGGYLDLTVDRVNCKAPWRGVQKTGTGEDAQIRFGPYRNANLHASNLTAGTLLTDDLIFEAPSGTPLADASAWTDDVRIGAIPFGLDTGGANTINLAVSSVTLTALEPGLVLLVELANSNTNSSITLEVNGLGAYPVLSDGAAIPAGVLVPGHIYMMIFDGSAWQVQSLPDVIAEDSTSPIRYFVRRTGWKRTTGKVDLAAGATGTYTLPVTHTSWVDPQVSIVDGSAAAGRAVSPVSIKQINRNSSDRPVSLTLVNSNAFAVTASVTTEGK